MQTADAEVTTWRSAFEQQATGPEMRGVHDYAETRARMVQAVSGFDDDLLAKELVLDALADTFAGLLTWNPDKASLAGHLCCVVRTRSDWMMRRARYFVRLPFEDEDSWPAEGLERAITVNPHSIGGADGEHEISLARIVLAELRSLACGDEHVFQLLDAYEEGRIERVDVIAATGMSEVDYHNARRRLSRLVERLPHTLRAAVVDGLS